ncbi:hypothetical protein [Ruania halotolerans]|uniref:hypothetical protein n=1 Tax=Ruania halotolerans TaxID=2897773 RepID=UPI001E52383C|nr:hypothetical protein [Ruania halotolerans]UFU05282.1 hypothetical protein LQF10_12515 [Ruania halotolerans]
MSKFTMNGAIQAMHQVRAAGVCAIALGLLVAIATYGSVLKTGSDLVCQERADTVPATIDGKPGLSFRDAQLEPFPTRLICTWEVDGARVETDAFLDPVSNVATGLLVGAGLSPFIVGAVRTRRT